MDCRHGFAVFEDVTLHYVTVGEGRPVVLLHGFPQTWREWRQVLPGLVSGGYRVIAPDLRGLGDSTRPHGGYDKKTVANDVWRLVHDVLRISSFFVVGHDWGGAVAFALAAAHRDSVARLAVLDMLIPGDGTDALASSQGRWHHLFFRTPDLPEALAQGREEVLLSWFYRNFGYRPDAVAAEDAAEYVRCYSSPGGLRAGFAYYRATAQDAADNRRAIDEGGKLRMPVLAVGGGAGFGRRTLVRDSLARVAENVEGIVIEQAGHWIPEEKPEDLVRHLAAFFGRP